MLEFPITNVVFWKSEIKHNVLWLNNICEWSSLEYSVSWLCSAGGNVSGMSVSDVNECVCSLGVNVSGMSVSDVNECVCSEGVNVSGISFKSL